MNNIKSLVNNNKLATILLFLPILFLGVLIIMNAVNVVFWDEWELTPIFQHIHSGHFYWADFWGQHNEHRILFPNIALTLLAELTHWNVFVECLANLAVASLSFWLLLRILKVTAKTSKKPVFLLFLLSLVWFSPVQVENWLWGWQLEWFFNVLGVVVVAYGLSRIKNARLSPKMLLLILAGGIFSQYSLGNGTLLWPIVLAALLYKRLPAKQIVATAATALVTTALYYRSYVNPAGAPPRNLATKEPVAYAKFVLLYLGRPLSYVHKPAMIGGLLLVLVFAGLSLYLFFRDKAKFSLSVPWIFLGLYAIASALVTGLARLGFGVYESTTSRYTTISTLLLISTIVLCWQNQAILRKLLSARAYQLVSGAVALVVFACVLSNAFWGVHAFNTQHKLLTYLKTCTHQANPSDACLIRAYPAPDLARTRVDYLKSIHWAGY